MLRFVFLLAISFFAFPLQSQTISLQPVVAGLKSPVGAYSARDGSGRLFIVEQGGTIRVWNGSQLLTTPFLYQLYRSLREYGDRSIQCFQRQSKCG